jgi:hypothetical protein
MKVGHHTRSCASTWRVTSLPAKWDLSQGASGICGPRPARDIPAVTTSPLPGFEAKSRKIAGILRSRLARDMAIARSQDSSTIAFRSGDLHAEGGA